MKEIVSIHVGQAGIQSGQSTWDLLCREHGCGPDGLATGAGGALLGDWAGAFAETDAGKAVPRCLLADLDPDVCDRVRRGPSRGLFHPDQVVSGLDDTASNFARARSAAARAVLDRAAEQVRRQAERSNRLGAVVVYGALGGGTGSGFGALLLDAVAADLGRVQCVQVGVAPSAHGAATALEPYNAVLGLHATMTQAQMSLLVDNRSLYDLAQRGLDVDRPSYVHANRLIAQIQSSITASSRFPNGGSLNLHLSDLQTNLVPYPRLHFPLVSFAPVVSAQIAFNERLSVQQITTAAFEPSNQMIQCNPSQGQYLACALIYRGDINPKDVNAAVAQLKSRRTMQFVDWCPTGFKVGINPEPPTTSPEDDLAPLQRSVLALSNTTAIATTLARIGRDFDRLYERGAFLHWYEQEGMEAVQFQDARHDLHDLERDYQQAGGALQDKP